MKYLLEEKLYLNYDNLEINFNLRKILSESSNQSDTYQLDAIIDNKICGFIKISNTSYTKFDKFYSIFHYINLYEKKLGIDNIPAERFNEEIKLNIIKLLIKDFKLKYEVIELKNNNINKENIKDLISINDVNSICQSKINDVFEQLNYFYLNYIYRKNYIDFKSDLVNKAYVDNIFVYKKETKKGVAKSLYEKMSKICNYNGKFLTSSQFQTEEGILLWKGLEKSLPVKKTGLLSEKIINFYPEIMGLFIRDLFLQDISSLKSYDLNVQKKSIFKHLLLIDKKYNNMFNPISLDKNKNDFILNYNIDLNTGEYKKYQFIFSENDLKELIGNLKKCEIKKIKSGLNFLNLNKFINQNMKHLKRH